MGKRGIECGRRRCRWRLYIQLTGGRAEISACRAVGGCSVEVKRPRETASELAWGSGESMFLRGQTLEDSVSDEGGGGTLGRSTIGVPLDSRPGIPYPRFPYPMPPPYLFLPRCPKPDSLQAYRPCMWLLSVAGPLEQQSIWSFEASSWRDLPDGRARSSSRALVGIGSRGSCNSTAGGTGSQKRDYPKRSCSDAAISLQERLGLSLFQGCSDQDPDGEGLRRYLLSRWGAGKLTSKEHWGLDCLALARPPVSH